MKTKILCIFILFLSNYRQGLAQTAYLPLNPDTYHLVERYEIKSGRLSDRLPTHAKPYQRRAVAKFADTISRTLTHLSEVDKFNLAYLQNDSWEWSDSAKCDSKRPILKKIYRKKSDFYHVATEDFDMHVNPVFYGFAGKEKDNNERLNL